MRGAAVPQSLPLARSNAEARVFLRLQPCHVCGSKDCAFDSAVLRVDGELVGRYRGGCAVCGAEREYLFRIPEQVLVPPADGVRFGDDRPSQLLDPGVWLWYSDRCARRLPEPGAALDDSRRRTARHTLATALAAVEEVLKFVPAGASAVPPAAFTSVDGRAVYEREPGRFDAARLAALRDHYASTLAGW
ncbi:hypothetical protein [Nocardia farcinica]|uniref:hypothetical protein n=1 Tax=Nocardia farcinica TaxID=37329 RepID=UPI001895D4CF|nr:hypothetical protein [Nocardia farcinica]MBF6251604.1 hypothetical protein [Nocardia farcinica]